MKQRGEITNNGKAVFYAVLWNSFRQAALDLGWTLALHGSLVSDIDIVAVKWTSDAKSKEELVKALSDRIGETIWKDHHFKAPVRKEHHRLCYTLSMFSDFHIDLSIIDTERFDEGYKILGELVGWKVVKERDGKTFEYFTQVPLVWQRAIEFTKISEGEKSESKDNGFELYIE